MKQHHAALVLVAFITVVAFGLASVVRDVLAAFHNITF